jgi:beta-glucosidase
MTVHNDNDAPSPEELVGRLTLQEKAALSIGADFWHTAPVDRLGIPSVLLSDGPHGLRTQLEEADHVGLSGSVPATCFPTACALGSSWDPDLLRQVGQAIAREARKWGVGVVLGPGINIKRSPLCGRNFEYLSEDPFLTGELATAMVQGIQALDVGTSLKHYAANNQETDRLRVSADVDERALREIYLPAFERVVTAAQPWTVMCAYNKINGTYASENRWLLTDVLRDEWGFRGLVVSDWGAVHDRVAALAAGLDLEMPPNFGVSDAAVIAAVRNGTLAEATLDTSVTRVLRLVERSGANPGGEEFDEAEHHSFARRVATECAVLLKNDNAVLPLRPASGQTIAVIGRFAREPRFQGAGSSQVNATRVDNPLEELRAAVGPQVTIAYRDGFGIDVTDDDSLLAEAVTLARAADHVLLFLGLSAAAESEGFDRTHIDLPANQLALIDALVAVRDDTAVVLTNGSVVRFSGWDGKVAAILETWLSGQAAGGAVADLLLGQANPSGKLNETIPVRLQDTPSYLNFPGDSGHVRYGEGLFVGYRGHDKAAQDVSYPFGFGLSYTTFSIGDVAVTTDGAVAGRDLAVTVRAVVTNTGTVAGAETIQVYVTDVESTVTRPIRELKGFTKVFLRPGERRRVQIELDERAFAFWSIRHDRWVVESGEFTISIGTSSRHIAGSATIALDAPDITEPLTADSTLLEWLADDHGRALLTQQEDLPLLQEDLVKVIGTMPMHTLAAFGMGIDNQRLTTWLGRLAGQPTDRLDRA